MTAEVGPTGDEGGGEGQILENGEAERGKQRERGEHSRRRSPLPPVWGGPLVAPGMELEPGPAGGRSQSGVKLERPHRTGRRAHLDDVLLSALVDVSKLCQSRPWVPT